MGRKQRQPSNYAEATHGSPWWIVRYAHEQRASVAVEMLRAGRPRTVLDWGTGDGRVLELLLDQPDPPELVLAYEPGEVMQGLLAEAKARHPLGDRIAVFGTVAELEKFLDGAKIDVIACLGVLEHLPLAPRREFYEFAQRYVSPTGSVLIDVPVEIGPAVLLKEAARVVLKGRPREYSTRDLLRRTFGRTSRDPERFADDDSDHFLGWHRDFDHRHLIEEMEQSYTVVERRNTPLRFAPSWLFNQEVLFRARPRSSAG
ncbi:MAG: class I SAM-dependent methyltransferase [Actinomycetota bacterium]|nr:class I SAM-dependent methyltransferase [Actinomycetota bacterium]